MARLNICRNINLKDCGAESVFEHGEGCLKPDFLLVNLLLFKMMKSYQDTEHLEQNSAKLFFSKGGAQGMGTVWPVEKSRSLALIIRHPSLHQSVHEQLSRQTFSLQRLTLLGTEAS